MSDQNNLDGGFKVPPRIIVTGNDEHGESIIISDNSAPKVLNVMGEPLFKRTDIWRTYSSPPSNEPGTEEYTFNLDDPIGPPDGGTVFRIVQFPPDHLIEATATPMEEAVETASGKPPRHFRMHTTCSVDYGIVLSGEIWSILDNDETRMLPGDIMIQRGTNHAWSNRTDKPCIMAFVLMSAKAAG